MHLVSTFLLLINPSLNPVALFCTSRAFRRHFKRYWTCRWKANSQATDLELARRNWNCNNRFYEGKSLNNRNFNLKCMEKYAQRKLLFRDTKWLLSNMSHRGRDDQAVWICAVGRTTWPLHCQLAPWKSNEALFVFVVRGCETFWNLQTNEGSVWRHRTFTCLDLWKNSCGSRSFQMTTR